VTGVYILAFGGATLMECLAVTFQTSCIHLGIVAKEFTKVAKARGIVTKLVSVKIINARLDVRQIVKVDEKGAECF
jgi:hypothetical protein